MLSRHKSERQREFLHQGGAVEENEHGSTEEVLDFGSKAGALSLQSSPFTSLCKTMGRITIGYLLQR